MVNGYRDKDKKFHPIKPYVKVRKKKDKSLQPDGVKITHTRKKVTPTKTLQKELMEVLPEHAIPDAVDRIQSEQGVAERIPTKFHKQIDFLDALEIEKMGNSKIKTVMEEKVDGMTVYNFTLENGEEFFIFKSLADENNFVEDNIRERFEKGEFDNDKFVIDTGSHPAHEVEPYDLIDFTKFGSNSAIKELTKDHVREFKEFPKSWLKKQKITVRTAIDKGALVRDADKFIGFKEKESGGEGLIGFEHPDYEMVKGLPSFKHSFKEKTK